MSARRRELVVEGREDARLDRDEVDRVEDRLARELRVGDVRGEVFWKLTVAPASALRRCADSSGSVPSPPISTSTFSRLKSSPVAGGERPLDVDEREVAVLHGAALDGVVRRVPFADAREDAVHVLGRTAVVAAGTFSPR